jgi:hypothetical protein
MEEVTLYLREKQHATVVTEFINESEIQISLKTDLDDSLFNYPLTLKTEVPSDWKEVRLICGSQEQTLAAREKDGHKVVSYNAVPNTGIIVLKKIQQ